MGTERVRRGEQSGKEGKQRGTEGEQKGTENGEYRGTEGGDIVGSRDGWDQRRAGRPEVGGRYRGDPARLPSARQRHTEPLGRGQGTGPA